MSEDLDNLNHDMASLAIQSQQISANLSGLQSDHKKLEKKLEEVKNNEIAFVKNQSDHKMLVIEKRYEESEDARMKSEREKQELKENYEDNLHKQEKKFDEKLLMTRIESLEQNEASRREQEILEKKPKTIAKESKKESVIGKVIGGAVGGAIGGPVGAVIGIFAGEIFDKNRDNENQSNSEE